MFDAGEFEKGILFSTSEYDLNKKQCNKSYKMKKYSHGEYTLCYKDNKDVFLIEDIITKYVNMYDDNALLIFCEIVNKDIFLWILDTSNPYGTDNAQYLKIDEAYNESSLFAIKETLLYYTSASPRVTKLFLSKDIKDIPVNLKSILQKAIQPDLDFIPSPVISKKTKTQVLQKTLIKYGVVLFAFVFFSDMYLQELQESYKEEFAKTADIRDSLILEVNQLKRNKYIKNESLIVNQKLKRIAK